MIKNIPDPDIFLNNSAELLYEAIHVVKNMVKDQHVPFVLEDEDIDILNTVKIGNIALLIFSSIENYLKYKIAQESPFLLISNLSDLKKGKKDFNDYHMHGFEDLLNLYSLINKISDSSRIKNQFENLRQIRNKFVHSILNDITYISELFKIAAFFTKEIWNVSIQEHGSLFNKFADISDPLFSYNNLDDFFPPCEECNEDHQDLLTMFEILSFYLTQNEALSFLGLTKSEKKVECPVCSMYGYCNSSITSFRFAKLITEEDEEFSFCHLCQAKIRLHKSE